MLIPELTRLQVQGAIPSPQWLQYMSFGTDISAAIQQSDRYASCFISWCSSLDGCASASASCAPSALIQNGTLSVNDALSCLQDICEQDAPTPINVDMLGVGMLCAYIMQGALAFAGVASLSVLTTIDFLQKHKSLWLRKLPQALRNPTKLHESAAEGSKRHSRMIILNLVDFQKAQCLFAIAAVIAGYTLQQNTQGGHSDAGFQRYGLAIISYVAMIPVVGNLWTLIIFHKISWYLFVMTAATYSLGFTLYHSDFITDSDSSGPVSCLRNTPKAYCSMQLPTTNSQIGNPIIMGQQLTSMNVMLSNGLAIILLIEHFARIPAIRRILSTYTTRRIPFWSTFTSPLNQTFRTYRVLLLAYLLTSYSVHFYILAMAIRVEQKADTNYDEWGFGQIIALTIWLPVLLEFGYQEVLGFIHGDKQGLKQAFDHRLPRPLTVSEETDQVDNAVGSQERNFSQNKMARPETSEEDSNV